jgi:hypothetical protein
MRDDDLMPFFLPIHFEPREFGQLYAGHGFFAIMKLTRFEDDYQWAVLQLARGPLYRGDPYGARGLHAARQYLKYAQGRQQATPPRPQEREDG